MAEHKRQQEKQHLTTAQLSAFLDGQLPIEEREFSDAHLATCEQCSQELEGLRQTVTLLHALPRPALPRSFTLPLSTQQTAPATPTLPSTPLRTHDTMRIVSPSVAPVPLASNRRTRWSSYGRTALRTVGTLAAMIGFVLLISSLIPLINMNRGAGSASNASGGSTGSAGPGFTQTTPGPVSTLQPHVQGTAAQPTLRPPQQPPHSSTSGSSLPPAFDINTIAGRAFFGVLLVILGIVTMILVRREPRRGP